MGILITKAHIIVGINWGAIPEKGWFGATQLNGVDLDMCCFEINQNMEGISNLNWEKRETSWGKMSQDDMSGDMLGNDQQDNEWLVLDLNKVPKEHQLILTVLNYTEQNISKLLHFDYRIYSGEPNNVQDLFYFRNMKEGEIQITDSTKGIFFGTLEYLKNEWVFNNQEIPMEELDFMQQFEQIKQNMRKRKVANQQ